MSLPTETPRLPKWIFVVGDAALLATAAWIATHAAHPASGEALIAIVACVGLAAVCGAIPFITDYAWRQEAALDERQRSIEALAGTVSLSAEQIGIAATGLHQLAELAQRNQKHGEQVYQELREKMAELQAQISETHEQEREDAARLEGAAERISKAVSDAGKLEAALKKFQRAAQVIVARPEPAPPEPAPPEAAAPSTPAPVPHAPEPVAREPDPLESPAAAEVPAEPAQPATTLAPAEPEPRTPSPAPPSPLPATRAAGDTGQLNRINVTAYIGIGNRLFIRGSGAGLNWDKGAPLQFVSIGKWRWEPTELAEPLRFKLYKNDAVECTTLGERLLEPGSQLDLTATF